MYDKCSGDGSTCSDPRCGVHGRVPPRRASEYTWFCGVCGNRYRPVVDRCPNCGTTAADRSD